MTNDKRLFWCARQDSNLWPTAPEAGTRDAKQRSINYLSLLPRDAATRLRSSIKRFLRGSVTRGTFGPTRQEVWIHGVRIAVPPDANVILLDDVDVGFVAGIPGPKVVGTLHIEPYLDVGPNRRLVPQDFIRRSPELISYLRCNTGE